MKFKSKEELIQDSIDRNYCSSGKEDFMDGVKVGIKKSFKSFAERVEFYKKYSNKPKKLKREQINDFNNFFEWYTGDDKKEKKHFPYFIDAVEEPIWRYNNWLFDFCFKDVIK